MSKNKLTEQDYINQAKVLYKRILLLDRDYFLGNIKEDEYRLKRRALEVAEKVFREHSSDMVALS